MPEAAKADDPRMTDVLEVKLTFVGSRDEVFARDARKRMPRLGHATELACGRVRDLVESRLGTGAGRRFTLLVASKLLTDDEKLALLAEHEGRSKKPDDPPDWTCRACKAHVDGAEPGCACGQRREDQP